MDNLLEGKIYSFFTAYPLHTYQKGQIILRSGDIPEGVYYLQSGFIRMYTISPHGDEVVLNLFKPMSFFPLSWAINDNPNLYFYEAIDTVKIYIAPKDKVLAFLHENPEVTFDILSRVFKGIDGMLTRMTYLMSGRTYQRLISEILTLARRFGKGQQTVTITIKEKDLASQTGMTRETVSRELKVLKHKNLVTFANETLTIPNFSALEAELSTE